MTTAQMDPWLPELELRPPAVSHAHRLSVEQAKVGLVWYYNSRHDALRANKYRDDAVFWRIRRLNQVLPPAALPQHEASACRMRRCCPHLQGPRLPAVVLLIFACGRLLHDGSDGGCHATWYA